MSRKISVAGLHVDALTKSQLITVIEGRIKDRKKTFMTTVYSEFLFAALRNKKVRDMLNDADIAVADGIGILWADYFLSKTFLFQNFFLKIIQAWWQVVYTGASILLFKQKLYQTFPEKIVGADFIWDLAELAKINNFSVYIWGGFEQTPHKVEEILLRKFYGLKIVGVSNAAHDATEPIKEINNLKPDILIVAFGPLKQESWIATYLPQLPVLFAIGLGGTLDYIVGYKKAPSMFIRSIGLEWLYRLITQPTRIKRIYNAVAGLILSLVRYKIFESCDYRQNAVAVVINKDNKILLCKRAIGTSKSLTNPYVFYSDYWQFPQGGMDASESVKEGSKRELEEETGIHSVEYLATAKFIHRYHWENGIRPLLSSKYQFKGQEQHTVFFKFTGVDEEFNLDQNELIDYKWLTIDEVLSRIAHERLPHAQAVLDELKVIL